MIHQVKHQIFKDHAETACPKLALNRLLCDRPQRTLGESQFDILIFEQPLVLANKSILRLGQNFNQRLLIQVAQDADYGQSSHKLRNQSVANQIDRLDLFQQLDIAASGQGLLGFFGNVEPQGLLSDAPFDDFFEADERPTADEKNIRRINRGKFLMGVLPSALWRNVSYSSFQDLEQRLLNAFAGNITRDRRVFVLAGDLIDFVDINDPLLRPLDVALSVLKELQDDVFDVLTDVAGLGQRRGVNNGERNLQQPRQGLCQERLAGSRGPDQQDVGLGQLNIIAHLGQHDALIVVINRYSQFLLRLILADDVFIKEALDLCGARQLGFSRRNPFGLLFFKDGIANRYAFVADISSGMIAG